MKILVTGANGQLGQLVIQELSQHVGVEIIAGVRSIDKANALGTSGFRVAHMDYDDNDTLVHSLEGVDRLLLISSSEVGKRTRQHENVIRAATTCGVPLIAYTSILHGTRNPMLLAKEHQQTESLLKSAGIPHVLLRNGWYTENYLASLSQVLAMGQLFGCAANGLLSLASRADYASAAAAVLLSDDQAGKVYELAGDVPCTMEQIAAEVWRQAGTKVQYVNLPECDYCSMLASIGLPENFAKAIADSDAQASQGALHNESRQLSALIGRSTTAIATSIAQSLQAIRPKTIQ